MKEKERQDLIDMINGMSEEEKTIVANTLPLDLCLNRIKYEVTQIAIVKDKLINLTKEYI